MPFREQQVGEHDPGALEPVRQIEHLGNDLEAVHDVDGRGDGARIIAVAGAEHLPEIALLGLGGHAGGWSGALHVDHHHWGLDHGGHAETFGHEREAAARGGAHGPAAGMRRADGHIDHANLIFHLPHHDAGLARVRGHPPVAWVPHSSHRSSVLDAATSAPSVKEPLHGAGRVVQVAPASAVKSSSQVEDPPAPATFEST